MTGRGNGCIMWNSLICSACHIPGLSKNSDRMDWQCGMHGREENLEQNFEHLEEMGHSERIILKWNLTNGLWKNQTSICYYTRYIFTHIFKIIFSTCFLQFLA